MNKNYYKLLINKIKLQPLDENLPSQKIQKIKCLKCDYIFEATPKGKVMNYKKYGTVGCAKCTKIKRYSKIDAKNIKRLNKMGFQLHQPYKNYKTKILISNGYCCNRPWVAIPENILNGFSICKPCNDDRKRKMFADANEERFKNACARLQGWNLYRLKVRHYSEKTYRNNKILLNPNNLIRARNGINNGVHLDHIVPIMYCFKNNIPPEICADITNLRIIPAFDNAQKWANLPDQFPTIFAKFYDHQ